jgi:cytochrome c-type biogenesis protein CcmE
MTDPRRQRRIWYAVGGVLIVAFLAFGATSFKSNLTPYVSIEEAMRRPAKVQVKGSLVPHSTAYVEASQQLRFGLADDQGNTMPVLYAGTKPGNFEEATEIGRRQLPRRRFHATSCVAPPRWGSTRLTARLRRGTPDVVAPR